MQGRVSINKERDIVPILNSLVEIYQKLGSLRDSRRDISYIDFEVAISKTQDLREDIYKYLLMGKKRGKLVGNEAKIQRLEANMRALIKKNWSLSSKLEKNTVKHKRVIVPCNENILEP